MSATASRNPLLAVSVGNTSIVFGLFMNGRGSGNLPVPDETLVLDVGSPDYRQLEAWIPRSNCAWLIGSVNRPAAASLRAWLDEHRRGEPICPITHPNLPISVDLLQPERVGIDRLAAAAAANRLRSANCPAIVIDAGTAITVDAISGEGRFLGGAILPGPRAVLAGLNQEADLLPLFSIDDFGSEPDAIGKNTQGAIFSGIHWGAIGAVREVTRRILSYLGEESEIFLTGNGIHRVSSAFGDRAIHVPHLVLSGTVLADFADSTT